MKKIITLCLLSALVGTSYIGYKKLIAYQHKNEAFFLTNPKTNIFRTDYLVFSSLYDFYKVLHLKKDSSIITQKNICLFKDEIFNQNKIWHAFNQKNLEKTFTDECKKQALSLDNQTVYEFNGWFCSSTSCLLTSFYYNDYIVTESKQVLKKNNQHLSFINYNQFMQETFGFETPEKTLILYTTDKIGIGNQLFQFWGNYIYALKKELTLVLTYHPKPLQLFSLPKLKILDDKHPFKFSKVQLGRIIQSEKEYPLLFNIPLSIKNLKGYEDFIIKNTKFKTPLSTKNLQISKKMQKEISVSIHIRRGDFITENYKLLNLSYYQNAIKYMKEKFKNPHFYVFSDDINWAKENLKTDASLTFVDWTSSAEEDLHLMTKTKHNIIANSTFSWWGAFLNPNKEKIVLIPETGFYNEGIEHMKVDDRWIVINE